MRPRLSGEPALRPLGSDAGPAAATRQVAPRLQPSSSRSRH